MADFPYDDTNLDVPSPEQRDWLTEQLRVFLDRGGLEPFVSAPVLEPTSQWFPDRWIPDVEGARTQLLRLLSYARLETLDVVVRLFTDANWRPPQLNLPGAAVTHSTSGVAALFAGIHDGVAYFGVAERKLGQPDSLIGTLAHEVAHAWRRSHQVELEDLAIEERMTDLTTIGLGFGILTTNAAYLYRSGTGDGPRMSQYSHSQAGYLGFRAMSYLLAAQAVVRGTDPRAFERRLEPTQRAAFRAAFESMRRDALIAALQMPPEAEWPDVWPEEPVKLERRLSAVQRAVREVGARFDAVAEQPFAAPAAAVPCAFEIRECRRRSVGVWGGFDRESPWTCSFALIEDPEMQFHLVVAALDPGNGEVETVAFGVVLDSIVRQRRKLRAALAPLFEANGCPSHPLLREWPTFYAFVDVETLDLDDMRELLLCAAPCVDLENLAPVVAAYEQHLRDPGWRTRPVALDTTDAVRCPLRPDGSRVALDRDTLRLARKWWGIVTQPAHVSRESDGMHRVWDRRAEAARAAAAVPAAADAVPAAAVTPPAGETRESAAE